MYKVVTERISDIPQPMYKVVTERISDIPQPMYKVVRERISTRRKQYCSHTITPGNLKCLTEL